MLASLSFVLGFVGVFLPVLPTVPFLLLTAHFYSKSSDKFYLWFINTKIYKKYLKDFIQNKTMTKKHKWTLLISVDIILLISFVWVNFLMGKIIILIVFLYKHYYFYKYVEIKP
jgi:hypothetical protein